MNFTTEPTTADDSQATVFASAPFDHLNGDIIIRSSNGIHFRMFKLMLSLMSPIFKDMLSIPVPQEGEGDATEGGLPIVQLGEDSQTIENLLSFSNPAVYTAKALNLETLSEVSALLEAATKYEMEETCRAVVPLLTKPRFLEQEPLRVFAIACRHRLEAEARLAAKHTLHYPELGCSSSPELGAIDGKQLYRVLLYRKECANIAMWTAIEHTWIRSPSYAIISASYTFFGCPGSPEAPCSFTRISAPPSRKYRHGRIYKVRVHTWWLDYMESIQVALQSSSCGKTVKDLCRVGPALVAADKCSVCRPRVADHFRAFIDEFAKEIDQKIGEVRLYLDF